VLDHQAPQSEREAVKVGLVWTGRSLDPLAEQDLDNLKNAYSSGEVVMVEVEKARNLKHHRKFFALFRAAIKHGCVLHGHRFHNEDALRSYVEICIGWCDYYDVGPVRMPVAKTIRFDAVDQTQFTKIFNQAVLFMADEIDDPHPDIVAEADELIAKGIIRMAIQEAA
jgi:hypothetical protein